jgi:hypothetical protein
MIRYNGQVSCHPLYPDRMAAVVIPSPTPIANALSYQCEVVCPLLGSQNEGNSSALEETEPANRSCTAVAKLQAPGSMASSLRSALAAYARPGILQSRNASKLRHLAGPVRLWPRLAGPIGVARPLHRATPESRSALAAGDCPAVSRCARELNGLCTWAGGQSGCYIGGLVPAATCVGSSSYSKRLMAGRRMRGRVACQAQEPQEPGGLRGGNERRCDAGAGRQSSGSLGCNSEPYHRPFCCGSAGETVQNDVRG